MNSLPGELGALARRKRWFDPATAPLAAVLMSGGKLHVPPEQYFTEFLPAFARDVDGGVKHYVIERATDPSKWYCDLDIAAGFAFDDAWWQRAAEAVHAVLCELSGAATTLVVLRAEADGTAGKVGVHMVAPTTSVTAAQMLAWRPAFVRRLAALAALTDGGDWAERWDEWFDAAVYGGGGSLRLVLARKMAFKDGAKVDVGRPYRLMLFINRDGRRDAPTELLLRRNTTLLVTQASIRRKGADTAAVPAPTPARAPSRRGERRPAGARTLSDLIEGLPPAHRDLTVLDERHGRVRVAGDGARECQIAGRTHSSSHIFYELDLTRGRATQRCWCSKGACRRGSFGSYRLAGGATSGVGALPPGFVR